MCLAELEMEKCEFNYEKNLQAARIICERV